MKNFRVLMAVILATVVFLSTTAGTTPPPKPDTSTPNSEGFAQVNVGCGTAQTSRLPADFEFSGDPINASSLGSSPDGFNFIGDCSFNFAVNNPAGNAVPWSGLVCFPPPAESIAYFDGSEWQVAAFTFQVDGKICTDGVSGTYYAPLR